MTWVFLVLVTLRVVDPMLEIYRKISAAAALRPPCAENQPNEFMTLLLDFTTSKSFASKNLPEFVSPSLRSSAFVLLGCRYPHPACHQRSDNIEKVITTTALSLGSPVLTARPIREFGTGTT